MKKNYCELISGGRNVWKSKFLRKMRTVALLLLISITNTFALESYAQTKQLRLNFKNEKILDILNEIENQSEFYFMYDATIVDVNQRKSISCENQPITTILDQLLKDTKIVYEISDRQIVLTSARKAEVGQQKTVSGRVTDSSGNSLPGVTIVIKETTQGTITDNDGNYSLSNVPGNATLVFSFVGMKTQEIPGSGKTNINVVLAEDAIGIEEVVAIGYGTMKKSDITGSLSSVSFADFEKQPLIRIDQALQGRAAGVQVSQTDGGPGGGSYKIRIRGANSISGDNDPLFVIDGIVVADYSGINANNIASMEILKDASATAVYGSRGANGVIIITTKSGDRNETKIVFNSYQGISKVANRLDMMTPAEYAEGVNFKEGGEIFTQQEIEQLRLNGGENWFDRLIQAGNSSNYELTCSGGNNVMDFYVSGNYYNAKGIITKSNASRYGLMAKINADLSEKVRFGLMVNGGREERTGERADLFIGLTWDMTTPAYDEEGDFNFTSIKPGIGNFRPNPLILPELAKSDNYENKIISSGYVDIDIHQNLKLKIIGGLDWLYRENNSWVPVYYNSVGNARVSNINIARLQNTNSLTYTLEKKEIHRLQIDAIHEQQLVTNVSTVAESEGFFTDNVTYKKLSLGEIQRNSNLSTSESLQSFIGRVNYSLLNKYLITTTLRADGASKFRKGQRWGFFPSGSIGWRISEENFMKNIEKISNLKLRVSYGITGSQGISPLATREQAAVNSNLNYPFTGGAAFIAIAPSNRLSNTDLTWEETAQNNVGLDLGLWDSKINLTFDTYYKHTYNLLLDRILPQFVGPTVVAENVGEVENKGFEINLNINPVRTKNWNVVSNISFNRNRNNVLALITDEPIEMGEGYGTNSVSPTRIEIGEPISSFRGYIFEGVYQLGEEEEAAIYNRVPGQAKYKDINSDDLITSGDITTVGNGVPDFTMGWNTDITWKNLDISFLFTGSYGNDIYNFQRARMMGLGGLVYHASHADYLNRWTPENPSNIPSNNDGNEILSTQFLEDGSYLTLKNVSLSYMFDNNQLFNKIGLNSLRLYGSLQNAFILTKYSGFDPETTATGNSDIDVGIDDNTYPLSRTIMFGIEVKF